MFKSVATPSYHARFINLILIGLLMLLTLYSHQARAGFGSLAELGASLSGGQPELLRADEAFSFSYSTTGNGTITLDWQVADKYYLYQDKIKVRLVSGQADLGDLNLPPAKEKMDPVFNKIVKAYHNPFTGSIPISNVANNAELEITFQGCADIGVCYPPMTKTMTISQPSFGSARSSAGIASVASTLVAPTANNTDLSETDQITATLQDSSLWIVIGTFFLFGLLLSLTPCIFPMIPILSGIIIGQSREGNQITTRKAFSISVVYVLSMSVTYTAAGVLAGVFGENLQILFQTPWIIASFSAIFILLALSMFGFYELQLPSKLQTKINALSNKQESGSMIGVAIMGFLSALIVGPCVAPPLAGALIYIGQTGDALLGGTALFAMSIGMGVPLLILGLSAGKLLPKAGGWMDNVKAVFGVMMLGVAIWMAERILPESITLFAWASLLIVSAVYLGAMDNTDNKTGWFKLSKGLGLISFIFGTLMLIGLAAGGNSVLEPLKAFKGSATTEASSEHLAFKTIKTLDELNAELKANPNVMLDFYADWCISCKEMENQTFTDAKIHKALIGVTLLQADVTLNDSDDKALMNAFNIIGPPAILFFNNAQETTSQRVVGFKNVDDFEASIQNGLK